MEQGSFGNIEKKPGSTCSSDFMVASTALDLSE